MKWTNKIPEVSGHYWFKQYDGTHGYHVPTIVRVSIKLNDMPDDSSWTDREMYFLGDDCHYDLGYAAGEWAGPIPPPKG